MRLKDSEGQAISFLLYLHMSGSSIVGIEGTKAFFLYVTGKPVSCIQHKTQYRRKIRLIEGSAKCRHPKSDLERDFAAALYLPTVTQCAYVHILIHTRRGGGELNQREGERGKKQIIIFLTIFLSWEEVSSFHVNQ